MRIIIANMNIILDQIALWRPKLNDAFAAIKQPAGLPIYNQDTKIYSKAERPLYRYAKNYTVGRGKNTIKFCLFVRSYSEDYADIEKQLDDVAKTITASQAREISTRSDYNSFDYLDKILEVK